MAAQRSTFGVNHPSCSRRGLSLLEVLFAIFVAAVGLLGLAALLTVGGVHSAQTEQADRSAAAGRAFMREVESRGMLRSHVWERNPGTGLYEPLPNWLDATSNGQMSQIVYPGRTVPVILADANGLPNVARLDPFIIDPLLMAENGTTNADGYYFPFRYDVEPTLRLPRLTLRGLYDPANLPRSREVAQRVFMSRDDLTTYQIDRVSRPLLKADEDNDGTPDTLATDGRYSYLVMVTPSELENPFPSQPRSGQPPYDRAVPLDQRRMFTVQVVVFHRRGMLVGSSPPSERQVKARLVSPQSAILEPQSTVPTEDQAAYLDGLAANQWILLSSVLRPASDDNGYLRPLHRWVRIASVGRAPSTAQATVNFSGPDWDPTIVQWTGENMIDGNPANAVATIADGVVGVYERTIELDARSMTEP